MNVKKMTLLSLFACLAGDSVMLNSAVRDYLKFPKNWAEIWRNTGVVTAGAAAGAFIGYSLLKTKTIYFRHFDHERNKYTNQVDHMTQGICQYVFGGIGLGSTALSLISWYKYLSIVLPQK